MIYHASISGDRVSYTVHLRDEENMFFIVPMENDGSENWSRLQAWLDEGNEVADDLQSNESLYQDFRRVEYPTIVEQLDLLFHGGYDLWKSKIQEIKDKYPKPESQ